jgi:hypothetical protein
MPESRPFKKGNTGSPFRGAGKPFLSQENSGRHTMVANAAGNRRQPNLVMILKAA